ncbi:hypothetical protein V6N13_012127 [Hibiscus sabdariffa]|uniref:VQ domain-containing protein n=1 Tax=Hibiscus sabdariffa TaxID=183260 RepID=A0ABR2SE72_9ROSI
MQSGPSHGNGPRPLTKSDQKTDVKNPKKRTRTSRTALTTVVITDTMNFRAIVQEFTGIPAPPFSGSSYSYSPRLDLFVDANITILKSSDCVQLATESDLGILKQAQNMLNLHNFPPCLNLPGFTHDHEELENVSSRAKGIRVCIVICTDVVGGRMKKQQSAFLIALFVIDTCGGGRMGDFLCTRLPNYGRIILAQISSASVIPLATMLFLVLPDDPSTCVMHGLVLNLNHCLSSFCISWNAPAANK